MLRAAGCEPQRYATCCKAQGLAMLAACLPFCGHEHRKQACACMLPSCMITTTRAITLVPTKHDVRCLIALMRQDIRTLSNKGLCDGVPERKLLQQLGMHA